MEKDLKHRMFWLTSEDQDISNYVFRTPRDYKEHSYGFLDNSK